MASAEVSQPEHNLATSTYLPQVRMAIEEELTRICENERFRSSRRNCEFLRFVVHATLSGRADEIKERTLGVEIFGRPIHYDTGSDAVVRVRANDVRKRLASYYAEEAPGGGWRIVLHPRTYVPVFEPAVAIAPLRADIQASAPNSEAVHASNPAKPQRLLSLRLLAIPTLIALFLCAATFRWQIFSGTPYLDFWQTFLHGQTSLIVVLDASPHEASTVTLEDLDTIEPLLSTAASFNLHTEVVSAGTASTSGVPAIHVTHDVADCAPQPNAELLGTVCVTVSPGNEPALWISGSSDRDLRVAILALSSRDAFPLPVELALHRSAPTRLRIAEDEPVTIEAIPAPLP